MANGFDPSTRLFLRIQLYARLKNFSLPRKQISRRGAQELEIGYWKLEFRNWNIDIRPWTLDLRAPVQAPASSFQLLAPNLQSRISIFQLLTSDG